MGELDRDATPVPSDSLIINGILCETECSTKQSRQNMAFYTLIYVTDGEGILQAEADPIDLSSGDVVLISPYVEWSTKSLRELSYIRITYFGTDAAALASRLQIKMTVAQFRDTLGLKELLLSCLALPTRIANLRCKGVVYCAFSELERLSAGPDTKSNTQSAAQKIKDFIDNNFTSSELSLNYLSEVLSYHSNYITTVFAREYQVSIVKYITILRVRHACFLMEHGISVIKDVAELCGYANPDYFSAVFKAVTHTVTQQRRARLYLCKIIARVFLKFFLICLITKMKFLHPFFTSF